MAEDKESLARTQLPYKAEYCKTSRARCKKCAEPMVAGSLKLATSARSRFHEGLDYSFNHVECFFRTRKPASVAEIAHYETLKYEDQKMLEEAVETRGRSVFSKNDATDKDGSPKKKGKKRDETPDDTTNYDDFLLEYAKSNRSTCVKCELKIEKDLIRIGKMDHDSDRGFPVPRWYHVDCFAKCLEKLDFDGSIRFVKGFNDIDEDDKTMLKNAIKPKKINKTDEARPVEKKKLKVDSEEEKMLKKQSERFFALREQVATMKRKDVEEMMRHMKQKYNYKNSSTLQDMAADVLLYGPLKRCPECKQRGHMTLRASRYVCTSSSEEDDMACNYETIEPRRGAPDVPDEIREAYDFFDTYRFRGGKRIFPSNLLKAVEEKEAENNNLSMENGPLKGINIGVTSWQALNTDKTKLQKKVMYLGGELITALDRSLFVILTSEDELKKDTPKMEVAKALDVPFATEKFIFKIDSANDVVKELSKCLLGEWNGDLKKRYEDMRG